MRAKQQAILEKTLPLVAFDGWSDTILRKAAMEAGFAPDLARIAFPQGATDAICFFTRQCDEQMAQQLSSVRIEKMKIRERIALAVKTRLQLHNDIRPVIRKTVNFLSMPQHAGLAASLLWKTVDCIWYEAGDTSSDFNYYTKRTLLAGVYSSTLLYWLKDDSENYQATWDFLHRRIENVMLINKARATLIERCADLGKLLG